ncbi:MAG: hypothetical protein P4L69_00090 [Desulfosporosinus sp.]|nr:hypothetical protein [Desulfosporosinus sp.]
MEDVLDLDFLEVVERSESAVEAEPSTPALDFLFVTEVTLSAAFVFFEFLLDDISNQNN